MENIYLCNFKRTTRVLKAINDIKATLIANSTLKSEESLLKPMLLGLRSNISEYTIRNNVFDEGKTLLLYY